MIDPGKVTISGSHSLEDWRTNTTIIDGSKIACGTVSLDSITMNTIGANKLTVGDRMSNQMNVVIAEREYIDSRDVYLGGYRSNSGFKETLTVEDEDLTWTIELPGIEKSAIQAYTIKNKVIVKVVTEKGERRTTFEILEEGTEVIETKLALGVLTIQLVRPFERVDLVID